MTGQWTPGRASAHRGPGGTSPIEIWEASGFTYRADRIRRRLRRDGVRVGHERVERLMREQGWQGAYLRRGWRGGSTRQDLSREPAPDLVNRQRPKLEPFRQICRRRRPPGRGLRPDT